MRQTSNCNPNINVKHHPVCLLTFLAALRSLSLKRVGPKIMTVQTFKRGGSLNCHNSRTDLLDVSWIVNGTVSGTGSWQDGVGPRFISPAVYPCNQRNPWFNPFVLFVPFRSEYSC